MHYTWEHLPNVPRLRQRHQFRLTHIVSIPGQLWLPNMLQEKLATRLRPARVEYVVGRQCPPGWWGSLHRLPLFPALPTATALATACFPQLLHDL